MKTQVPVLVLVTAAVTAVAQGGAIAHMDRKDFCDGKVRLAAESIEHRSLPAVRFAIPKGFTQTTVGGGNE
jgi:hypothetical protein